MARNRGVRHDVVSWTDTNYSLANSYGIGWSTVTQTGVRDGRVDLLWCKTHVVVRVITRGHLVRRGAHA